MNALGILAGPRKGHATDVALDAVLKGLSDGGADVEKVDLYALTIQPCRGCYACAKTRRCVIQDDHPALLDKVGRADVLVFATPTYWSNVSSEAKKFFDRSLALFEDTTFGPRRRDPRPSRIVLLTSCGAPFPFSHLMGIVPGAMRAMKAIFRCTRARLYPLAITGMMDPAASRPSPRHLGRAYALGKRLARACIRA